MNPIKKQFKFGNNIVTLETGRIARQTNAAVLVSIDADISLLVTVVAAKDASDNKDFFPLSVHYQEKSYAAGKIPGGYLKREGRPSDNETLTSRLIDRPIRPLFPDGFYNEVQILCTVLSTSKKYHPDIACIIGVSAALAISGIPFHGPIGAARVGFHPDTGYILNPSFSALKQSHLDMVVAGTHDAVLMVESEAQELTEDQMLGAILFAHQEFQVVIDAVNEFAESVAHEPLQWAPTQQNLTLIGELKDNFADQIADAYTITIKQQRYSTINALKEKALALFTGERAEFVSGIWSEKDILKVFADLEYHIVRDNILSGKPRIDGRDLNTVRKLYIETGVLPNVHGSALFTRGETQALVVATLGTEKDAQILDNLDGETKDWFIFHYNFPPYSVGEIGKIGSTGRREIGHGRLAKRSVMPMLPKRGEFPYIIRVVSEITESNGSSSMASVCGASLALMDAGVPLMKPVAGIAMGLVLEGDKFAVLTDILGDEDHLGDMDFKVAGTNKGVTALQMDIKVEGITEEIMEIALREAYRARIHILEQMNNVLPSARELSSNAPVILVMRVEPEKVGSIIGKGGSSIKSLTEKFNVTVDIDETGQVKIFAHNKEQAELAKAEIELLTTDIEVGKTYVGKVVRIVDFGAFVNIMPGKDGLVHVSAIAKERVEKVSDYLTENQEVVVRVIDINKKGQIQLSIKDV